MTIEPQHERHAMPAWLRDAVDYALELVGYRAEVLAETESAIGAADGQRIAWGRMIEDGVVPPTVRKMWVAVDDNDVDEACLELDGEAIPLDELFSTDAGEIEGPPLHPHCRCALTLVEGDD